MRGCLSVEGQYPAEEGIVEELETVFELRIRHQLWHGFAELGFRVCLV